MSSSFKILFVDDDNQSRESITSFFQSGTDYHFSPFSSCEDLLKDFSKSSADLIISDIRMPGMSGIELLERVREFDKEVPFIIITGFGDLETSIRAIRSGASDYILKPLNIEDLLFRIEKIESELQLKRENIELKKSREEIRSDKERTEKKLRGYAKLFDNLGNERVALFSEKLQSIYAIGEKLHHSPDIPVLITGETGTGKEIIARYIHSLGEESSKPFISVNCAAITPSLFESEIFGYEPGSFTGAGAKGGKGKLELAEGGTLFLDEIGDLPIDLQPKLLRVVQEREYLKVGGEVYKRCNVRIICATNLDLQKLISEKLFREELYYRLNSGEINLPPLRERREEIIPLAEIFLESEVEKRSREKMSISAEAKELLLKYNWPGNIRELRTLIERIVLIYDDNRVREDHIYPFLRESSSSEINYNSILLSLPEDRYDLKDIEYIIAKKIIEKFNGNINGAAKYLNISWATLVKKARLKG